MLIIIHSPIEDIIIEMTERVVLTFFGGAEPPSGRIALYIQTVPRGRDPKK